MSKSTPLNQLDIDIDTVKGFEDEKVEKQVQDVLQNISENFQPTPALPSDLYNLHQQFVTNQQPDVIENENEKNKEFTLELDNDIKYALMCASIFIIVTYIPIEDYILNYISLGHIPHAKIFIKATLAGLLFFLIKKFLPLD